MIKRFCSLAIAIIIISGAGYALQYINETALDFSAGQYTQTEYDATFQQIVLLSGYDIGYYTGEVIDSGDLARVSQLSVVISGGVNMSDLIFLSHHEDSDATNITDHSGRNQSLTCISSTCTTQVQGRHGTGTNFDGNDIMHHALPAGSTDFDSNAFTVGGWINARGSRHSRVIGYSDSLGKRKEVYLSNNNKVRVFIGNKWYETYNSVPNARNNRHHIVATYQAGDPKPMVYVDGISMGLNNGSNYNSTIPPNTIALGIIGAGLIQSNPPSSYFLDGVVDETFIFKRALNATEIEAIYDNGLVNMSIQGSYRTCSDIGCSGDVMLPLSRHILQGGSISTDALDTNPDRYMQYGISIGSSSPHIGRHYGISSIALEYELVPRGDVLINEVEYDPKGLENGSERFELYNAGTGTVYLSGRTIADGAKTYTFTTGSIVSGGYYVITNKLADFVDTYPNTAPDLELSPDLQLNNNGDHLTLKDHYGREIDYVEREGNAASLWNIKAEDKPICRMPNGNDATGTGADRSELCYATPGAANDIDDTPPRIAEHTVTLSGGNINQPTIVFTGTDYKSGIRLWTIIIDEGGADERSVTLSGGATSYRPSPDLTGDRHTVTYTAIDRAGNSTGTTITYPPIVTRDSSAAISGSTITDNTITITGPAAMEIVSLTASGAKNPTITCTPPLSRTTPRAIGPTGFTCTVGDITTGGLITYTAVSNQGFTGSTQQSYIIDKRAPRITFPSYVGTSAVYSGTISIQVEDDTTVSSQYGRVASTGDCLSGVSLTEGAFGTGTTFDIETEVHNDHYLCVRAEDIAGNTTYQTSSYPPVIDRTPPVITLQGGSSISLEEGNTFTDPGAICADAITSCTLTVSGTVDTTTPGTYIVTYTAVDTIGNTSQTTRTVTVTDRRVVTGGSGGGWDTSDHDADDSGDQHTTTDESEPEGESPLDGLLNPDFVTQCVDPLHEATIYQDNDVTQDFRDAHQLIYSYGLTRWRGTADYGPERQIIREEAARFFTEFATNILCRTPSYEYQDNFTDIDDADPTLHDYIRKSFEYGIFQGDGGDAAAGVVTTFRPKDIISEDELAAILVRLVTNNYKETDDADRASGYHQFLDYHTSTSLIHTSRDNTARLIYDLYRTNPYNRDTVGYVIDKPF